MEIRHFRVSILLPKPQYGLQLFVVSAQQALTILKAEDTGSVGGLSGKEPHRAEL